MAWEGRVGEERGEKRRKLWRGEIYDKNSPKMQFWHYGNAPCHTFLGDVHLMA